MNPNYEQNLGHGPEVVLPTATLPPERGSERWFLNKWFRFGGLAIVIGAVPIGLLLVSPSIRIEYKVLGTLISFGISLAASTLIINPFKRY